MREDGKNVGKKTRTCARLEVLSGIWKTESFLCKRFYAVLISPILEAGLMRERRDCGRGVWREGWGSRNGVAAKNVH